LVGNASYAEDYQRDAAEIEWRRGLDIGAEVVSKDRKSAPFGDPHIRQKRYRENHQGIGYFSKDRFRQVDREETLQGLIQATPQLNGDSRASTDRTISPPIAAVGKIGREPILLLINLVFSHHTWFFNFGSAP
jgi:hypothetical protein